MVSVTSGSAVTPGFRSSSPIDRVTYKKRNRQNKRKQDETMELGRGGQISELASNKSIWVILVRVDTGGLTKGFCIENIISVTSK